MNHSKTITKKLAGLLSKIVNGTAQGEEFFTIIEQMDRLVETEKKHLPAELRHFLSRRSYVKAADFIDKMNL